MEAAPIYPEMGIWPPPTSTLPPSAYSITYGAPLPLPEDSTVAPSAPFRRVPSPNAGPGRSEKHSARTTRAKSPIEKKRRPREGEKGKKRQRQKKEYKFKFVTMDLDKDGSVIRADAVYWKEADSTPGVPNVYLETRSHEIDRIHKYFFFLFLSRVQNFPHISTPVIRQHLFPIQNRAYSTQGHLPDNSGLH